MSIPSAGSGASLQLLPRDDWGGLDRNATHIVHDMFDAGSPRNWAWARAASACINAFVLALVVQALRISVPDALHGAFHLHPTSSLFLPLFTPWTAWCTLSLLVAAGFHVKAIAISMQSWAQVDYAARCVVASCTTWSEVCARLHISERAVADRDVLLRNYLKHRSMPQWPLGRAWVQALLWLGPSMANASVSTARWRAAFLGVLCAIGLPFCLLWWLAHTAVAAFSVLRGAGAGRRHDWSLAFKIRQMQPGEAPAERRVRLARARVFMERYTATHVDGRVRAAATVAAFCSAGALAAGALITAVDDEAPLELHWLGRNLLWWMGAAGAAFVAATSALPDESATPVDFETDVAPHLGGVASANAAYAARHFCHVLVLLARNVAALLLLPWFVAGPLPRVVVGVHRAAWQEQVVALPSTASHPPPPRHQSVVRPLRV